MELLGDVSTTLLDLTIVAESEIVNPRDMIHNHVCSRPETADMAYLKIPIQTRVPWPQLFTGETRPESTEVAVIAEYNKSSYTLDLQFDGDTMRESKATSFADKTQEDTLSAVYWPAFNMTTNIIAANATAYDGKAMYSTPGNASTYHYYAGVKTAGNYTICNASNGTGVAGANLWTDFQKAVTQMGIFRDGNGRVLNPLCSFGRDDILIHCSKALYPAMVQAILHPSFYPVAIPTNGTGSPTAATGETPATVTEWKGIAGIFADPYLDLVNNGTWYVHYIGMPQKPFIYTESYPLYGQAQGWGSPFHQMTRKVRISTAQRWVQGTYRFDRTYKIINNAF